MKRAELARALRVSPQAIDAWMRGVAKPVDEHRLKLEELLGIPLRAWVEPAPDDPDATADHAPVEVDHRPTGT